MQQGIIFPEVFPEFRTERTNLIWISGKERAFIHRLYSDPKVQEFRGAPAYSSVEEAEEQIWRWRKMFAEQNGIRWGIFHREAQVMIGTAGLKNINTRHLTADLSYELIPGWWNLGIMTEVLTKLCDYSLNEIQLHSLQANIDPSHGASRRVLEKLQFRNEAHLRENWYHEGWWDSSIWVKRG
jgi:ribosomal-protein-alanine N-acetyltransferase